MNYRDFQHWKIRVPGLLCGTVGVILRLAVSVDCRTLTRDRETDT